VEVIAVVTPQLFWIAQWRRHPVSIVCISVAAMAPPLFEDGVVAITEHFRPS
jgi:hypothetical protein